MKRTIASYCSPSGDVCFGIFARNREVLLRISTAAHYFSRYMLCVRRSASGASGRLRCGEAVRLLTFKAGGSFLVHDDAADFAF